MNTTMADGARERLVAQIGEALFGRPGLTLMELAEKVKASQPTPSSRWAANGEADPHGSRYDCERAALVMGDLSDDELANAVFLHGNEQPTMAQMVSGAMLPTAYLTAAKDRIRWLSRALAAAQAKNAAPPSPAGQGHALPPVREDQPLRGDEPIGEQHDARIFNRGWNACPKAAAALAALQPVSATGKHSLTVGGAQAVAWMTHHDEPMLYPTFSEAAAYCDDDEPPIPLYAAPRNPEPVYQCPDCRNYEHRFYTPPAQTVDLGQFRPAVRSWLCESEDRIRRNGDESGIFRGQVEECTRLLALIDSNAVGDG